ncbi:hypothetical protein [Natrialba asiatica]|uniref:hypothetical protein n=1 Tax=Natrialba asiatica TaxID=64602 RepID=UPI0012690D20|nr:hypothetical protein [Natrialba asiatica]
MVSVSWERETGRLVAVQPGDGPGKYSAGVDPDAVREQLSGSDHVSEMAIAASVASAYDGPFSIEKTVVTTETYDKQDTAGVLTTLAFVEIADIGEKLGKISCENCNYTPDDNPNWLSQEREGPQLQYMDWLCPECNSIVHTEAYGSI